PADPAKDQSGVLACRSQPDPRGGDRPAAGGLEQVRRDGGGGSNVYLSSLDAPPSRQGDQDGRGSYLARHAVGDSGRPEGYGTVRRVKPGALRFRAEPVVLADN